MFSAFRIFCSGHRAIGGAMLAASLIAFLYSNQFAALKLAFNFWDPLAITQYRLSQLSDEEYKAAVEQALGEGDISEAQSLVVIARENGRELPAELVERTQENPFEFGVRTAWSFANGATTGEVSDAASISGALAADYVGVGDARDVLIEGTKLIKGENYDKLTLGLSLAGLATVVPGSGTADIGFSLVKTANKAGKLSKGLATRLRKVTTRLIHVDELKRGLSRSSLPKFKIPSVTALRATLGNVNWGSVAKGDFRQLRKPLSEMMPMDTRAAKEAFSGAIRKEAIDEIGILTRSASGVMSSSGVNATLRAMEHADDAKELSRFRTLAAHMGDKTGAIIKVLGKNAIKLGKLLYTVIIILIAVLGWILSAMWFLYSVTRPVYRSAKRARGAA